MCMHLLIFKEVKPTTDIENVRFIDAIQQSLRESLHKHKNLVLMGQDIAEYGGAFKITEGFVKMNLAKTELEIHPFAKVLLFLQVWGLISMGLRPLFRCNLPILFLQVLTRL